MRQNEDLNSWSSVRCLAGSAANPYSDDYSDGDGYREGDMLRRLLQSQ